MLRLIIVDNEPNIVRGIKQLLEEEAPFELDVYCAISAEEALQLLNKMKIDIALLDIRMPGMNGLELQAKIMEQWPQCKVVFLSGYDDFTFIQTALRNGRAVAHFLVTKLKSYIDHHLDEDLSLDRLSEIVYLNPTYLSRLLKQQAGQGVSQYIMDLRLTNPVIR
ncbi:response regulator transcription factor [Cohnella silvisoli]|uniref:Response regulator n=1 Tax=Cohnella silvisoli TaxID=2873699 RepID=A0ABV1KT57_9BACL|nr:response regulator [Cohnella silvisoli]MCD9022436.1 response regulator [Cohnella silvisoli]